MTFFWGRPAFKWRVLADAMPTAWVRAVGFSVGRVFIGIIYRDKQRERESIDKYVATMKKKGIYV